jgi:hypothetical protein
LPISIELQAVFTERERDPDRSPAVSYLDLQTGRVLYVIPVDSDGTEKSVRDWVGGGDGAVVDNLLERSRIESAPDRFLKIPQMGMCHWDEDEVKKAATEWLAENGIEPQWF